MIGASQSNFGRADKGNPFDAKSQTLSEFNKNCTQSNEHVPSSLCSDLISPNAQANIVQKYFAGSTRIILTELTTVTLNQYIRDTSGLLQIDDKIQMQLIIKKTILTDTFSLIEQMCKNLFVIVNAILNWELYSI